MFVTTAKSSVDLNIVDSSLFSVYYNFTNKILDNVDLIKHKLFNLKYSEQNIIQIKIMQTSGTDATQKIEKLLELHTTYQPISIFVF